MHELSIALSILDIAAEQSEQRGGAGITEIHIRLGPLSGVVKEALLSAFELAREPSAFSDCCLVIEESPVRVYCAECREERPVESIQMMCCAVCGSPAGEVLRGREMEITAMQIEENSSAASHAARGEPQLFQSEVSDEEPDAAGRSPHEDTERQRRYRTRDASTIP